MSGLLFYAQGLCLKFNSPVASICNHQQVKYRVNFSAFFPDSLSSLYDLCHAHDGHSASNAASVGWINKRQCRGAHCQPWAARVTGEVSNANAPPVQGSRDNLAAEEINVESVYANEDTVQR